MTSTVTVTAADPVRLAIVPSGSTIVWSAPMPSSDDPTDYLHMGVIGNAVGRADLGNQGFAVVGCPCGFSHNVSRYTPVTVVSTIGVPPANAAHYEDEEQAAVRARLDAEDKALRESNAHHAR